MIFFKTQFKYMRSIFGFTLIELLVVVSIVGILVASGIKIYKGFEESGKATVTKTIFKKVENYIKSEIVKCKLGETRVFSNNLTCVGRTGSKAVRAAEQALRNIKNPYNTSQNAIVLGDRYIKGMVYITASNQNIILHVCYKESCGNDANKDGVIINID